MDCERAFADAGVFAMTRENLGFIRQLTEMAQNLLMMRNMLPPGNRFCR